MQLAPGAPDPASIPDLTFGFGGQTYDTFQALGAALETALLNNVNLAGVLANLGFDPETAINDALGNALVNALTGVTINTGSIPVLGPVLTSAGITNVAALLDLLGFNLLDPLNLSGTALGVNVITAGPPFSLLKFLGIDLGWVPGFPNSVADEINGTPYLGISPLAVLQALKANPLVSGLQRTLILDPLIATVSGLLGNASVVDVRVPVVLGFGLGAFAAGMAYPQVVADLANQPGGANNVGVDPLLGSLTILPMILLRNPGRANGGLFARAYPLAGLFGVDAVTPDTAVSSSSDGTGLSIPIGNTGIVLGSANLIPVKVDATAEYDPLSDVPAWPNPVSLLNSGAALLFPTYLLRGITAASLTEVLTNQLTPQLAAALASTAAGNPLALNLYLTVPVNNALPLLEPIRLPIDLINLFTGANLNNPIATALEPALTTLVNLGYTDVKRTVVNGLPVYERTLDQANVITPFGTLPSGVDWGQVPGDLFVQLVAGVQKAIAQGLVGSPGVNPLAVLANLLGVNGLPGAVNAVSPLTAATDLPSLAAGTGAAGAQNMVPLTTRSKAPALTTAAADDSKVEADADPVPTTPVSDRVTPQSQQGDDTPSDEVKVDDTKPAETPAAEVNQVSTPPAKSTGADAAAKRAQARADAALKRATARLDKIAKDGQQQIQKVVDDASGNVDATVKAAPAQDKSADKASDKPSDGPAD
ncbi:PE-PPE domain-containing protein [Mycolicibacterium sp. P1-18]|nr:PE-PPE domain-containing protein [Mycolicibacterium sp. P1-18]